MANSGMFATHRGLLLLWIQQLVETIGSLLILSGVLTVLQQLNHPATNTTSEISTAVARLTEGGQAACEVYGTRM